MAKKALKDIPLQEITLRKYEAPNKLEKKELVKKFCLSIGLLQPGESRDIVVDIMLALVNARKTKKSIVIADFEKKLKEKPGASPPNIRRQLRRLKELKLVEKTNEGYRVNEFGSFEAVTNNYIHQYLVNPAMDRVKEYAKEIDKI